MGSHAELLISYHVMSPFEGQAEWVMCDIVNKFQIFRRFFGSFYGTKVMNAVDYNDNN